MKTCKAMQEIVIKISEKYGLDLTADEVSLRLDMVGFDRLIIKKTDQDLVSVGHYLEQGANLIGDPEIIFYTGYGDWIPVEISQVQGGYRIYAVLSADRQSVVLADPFSQAQLAVFAEGWAQNIKAQDWLEHGIKWDPGSNVDPCSPDESQTPDLDTLIAWADEGMCEATDGCVVEPDGTCPHGCRSWLLELGLI